MTNAEISCNLLLINSLSSELIFSINSLSIENNFVVFVSCLMALETKLFLNLKNSQIPAAVWNLNNTVQRLPISLYKHIYNRLLQSI
jgi:hypothetical protein